MVGGLPVRIGPWGGTGGTTWATYLERRFVAIVIVHQDCIIGLKFFYKDPSGTIRDSQKFGGDGGNEIGQIKLDDDEVITGISGTFGPWPTTTVVIRSLSILTNKQKYGPYGMDVGTAFSLPVPVTDSKIVGFFGNSGDYLDAIGAYVKAI